MRSTASASEMSGERGRAYLEAPSSQKCRQQLRPSPTPLHQIPRARGPSFVSKPQATLLASPSEVFGPRTTQARQYVDFSGSVPTLLLCYANSLELILWTTLWIIV
jgi:hypothetical protein